MKRKFSPFLLALAIVLLYSCTKETASPDNSQGDSSIDLYSTLTGTGWEIGDLMRLGFISDTKVTFKTTKLREDMDLPYDNMDTVFEYYYAEKHGQIMFTLGEEDYRLYIELNPDGFNPYGSDDILSVSNDDDYDWALYRTNDVDVLEPDADPEPDVSINSIVGNTYRYYQDFGEYGYSENIYTFDTENTVSSFYHNPDGTEGQCSGTYSFASGRGVFYDNDNTAGDFIVTGPFLYAKAISNYGESCWIRFELQ